MPRTIIVTRRNFERYLDTDCLYVAMRNGRWWRLRRNGATKLWQRDPERIRVPVKAGLKSCSAITEADFDSLGRLNRDWFRHVDDIAPNLRSR